MKRKQYIFGDLDTEDEIIQAFEDVQSNADEAISDVDRSTKRLTSETKRLADEVTALWEEFTALRGKVTKKKGKDKAKKGKGFVMKHLLSLMVLGVLVFGAVARGQFVKSDLNYDIVSNPDSLERWLRDTVASGTFEYTPIAAPTGNDIIEGKVYYDSSSNALFLSTDGLTWTQLDTAGGTSLDASYNLGNTIDVDGDAVTMTTSDTDNNVVLAIAQNDSTNDPDAMTITMAASHTGTALTINSVASGTDIAGDNWSVTQAGVITNVGLIVGGTDIVMENSGVINNTTDNEIEFIENTEEFSFAFNGNTLTLATDTGIDTLDWGTLTTASGMNLITGDAADLTLSITADAGGEDLLITQDGVVDGSVHIVGAGTGADAISLITSAGGIDITVVGAAAGEDLDLDTNSSLNLGSSEAAVDDAIVIETTGAGSGIRIISLADIDITTTGAATEDITLDNQGGSIHLISTEAVTDGMNLDATGGIDIDTGDDFAVTVAGAAGEDILMTNTGGSYILSATEAIADAITLSAPAGGIDITSAATFDIDITATLGKVLVVASEAAADQFKVDAQGVVVGNAINLETTDGGILLNADGGTNGDIGLNAASEMTLTTAGVAILPVTATFEHKYQYIALSAGTVAATEVMVIGGAPLICTSLEAGVSEAGATEGYVGVGDDEDVLIFGFTLPADFIDTGTQADLILEFDIDEQAAEEVNIDIRIFEYDDTGNAVAIITDTVVAANDATRAWKSLVTNSAGIGNEADLNGEESLIIEITANADADDFNIYGIRLLYRVGVQALQ